MWSRLELTRSHICHTGRGVCVATVTVGGAPEAQLQGDTFKASFLSGEVVSKEMRTCTVVQTGRRRHWMMSYGEHREDWYSQREEGKIKEKREQTNKKQGKLEDLKGQFKIKGKGRTRRNKNKSMHLRKKKLKINPGYDQPRLRPTSKGLAR